MTRFSYSIVATTYNDEKTITRYIEEVLQQTLRPDEIVIADGGSSDSTVEILEIISRSADIPIVVLSGERLNIAKGYNKAISSAKSEFIGITGIGNRYDRHYFEKLTYEIENSGCDGAYSPIRGYDSTWFSKIYNKAFLNGINGECMDIASNHGVLLRKSVFENIGYFYERFIYAGEDTEFYRLVKQNGYNMKIVPDAIMYWETPENLSQFKKQIKVYSIADIQIDSNKVKLIVRKNILRIGYVFVLMVGFVFIFVAKLPSKAAMIALIVIIGALTWKRKFTRPIRFYRMLLKTYYSLRYMKYSEDQYKVKRG